MINWPHYAMAGNVVKNAGVIGWSEAGSDEFALIERCLAGDEVACTELVAAHQRMVFTLALHLLGNREEALDLSQDVFLRVFRTLPGFRGQSALRTWIYRIVVNQARNRLRGWKRRFRGSQVSLDDHVEQHGDLPATREAPPDRLLASKEAAEHLSRALDRLPFEQRTAVILREVEGLSYDEIAFSVGIAVGTVKSRLTRARHALRASLLGLQP